MVEDRFVVYDSVLIQTYTYISEIAIVVIVMLEDITIW